MEAKMSNPWQRNGSDSKQTKVDASAWFNRREAEQYEILEQSISYGAGRSLTLLEFVEYDMLEEVEYNGQFRDFY